MSLFDKAKNKTHALIGKGKERTGRATGDQQLEAEGQKDQVASEVKQVGEKLKDKLDG
jgi:uncharacterized protein YjbJ (UPF0337 family)